MAALEVIKDGAVVERVQLGSKALWVLGKGEECDVALLHASVSRRHAQLELGPHGAAWLTDCSTNGSFCNGRRLAKGVRQQLFSGDLVSFAESTRKYLFLSDEHARPGAEEGEGEEGAASAGSGAAGACPRAAPSPELGPTGPGAAGSSSSAATKSATAAAPSKRQAARLEAAMDRRRAIDARIAVAEAEVAALQRKENEQSGELSEGQRTALSRALERLNKLKEATSEAEATEAHNDGAGADKSSELVRFGAEGVNEDQESNDLLDAAALASHDSDGGATGAATYEGSLRGAAAARAEAQYRRDELVTISAAQARARDMLHKADSLDRYMTENELTVLAQRASAAKAAQDKAERKAVELDKLALMLKPAYVPASSSLGVREGAGVAAPLAASMGPPAPMGPPASMGPPTSRPLFNKASFEPAAPGQRSHPPATVAEQPRLPSTLTATHPQLQPPPQQHHHQQQQEQQEQQQQQQKRTLTPVHREVNVLQAVKRSAGDATDPTGPTASSKRPALGPERPTPEMPLETPRAAPAVIDEQPAAWVPPKGQDGSGRTRYVRDHAFQRPRLADPA
jgi:hypothetical protein